MGLFDTIIVDPPLTCSRCGVELEIQTKHFDPAQMTYRVGSRISGSPVLSGILAESVFCLDCRRAGREQPDDAIFLVIWHSILAGVERTEPDAESRLASIDRLDLIEWLDEAQRAERDSKRCFWDLYRDVEMWHEHLHREDSEDQSPSAARSFARIFRLPDEVLAAEDPLDEILKRHKETSPERDGLF
ncbi:MAG: hypothetical protein EA426_19710 [Spirochaetaceae bacterium]|nr:MAG: hypothetical protein EA426_19710 [Spirochaetaceae bacterium]